MNNVKTYTIGGVTYKQSELVLGQIRQLSALLKGVVIAVDANKMEIVNSLGDKIPQALAIVLNPDGLALKDKDLTALGRELEFTISFEQTCEVVEDFFDCNPIVSLLEKLTGTLTRLRGKIQEVTSSPSSSASSAAEISSSETVSSGDSPLASADPT